MGYWDDVIQWVEEWRPVNYSVTEDEDFETVKQRAVRDFKYYLKLLDDGTEESRGKVYKSLLSVSCLEKNLEQTRNLIS